MISSSNAKEVVVVGLAHFPPFIEARSHEVSGLAKKMLSLMNKHQDKYEFISVRTMASARHREFKAGKHDMSLFDNLSWGWEGFDVKASNVYLTGGEVYIALAKPGRDQSYFSDFKHKQMIGMAGYHYGFADFNSDAGYLQTHYNMNFTESNLGSIKMLLAGNRGDIGVVTKAFLAKYLLQNSDDKEKLLISKKMDQEYNHSVVIRNNIKPTVEEINVLLQKLNSNGSLPFLWRSIQSID